jgi:hypothetical protein
MLLAELQRTMIRTLLNGGDGESPPTAPGPVPPSAALGIHRHTVQAALCNALRLTFPTVDNLVGADFFDQTARAYSLRGPPPQARLADYGADFPRFLETYPPVSALPYLADAALLDLAVARTLAAPDAALRRRFAIDAVVTLTLPMSLTVLELGYPADLIRAALEADDDEALAALELTRRSRFVAVWRFERHAVVTALSGPAGRFLGAILAGSNAEAAFASAVAEGVAPEAALEAIQRDVFAAAFCRIADPDLTEPAR